MGKKNILGQFSKNVVSQFGEDGILEKIFQIIPDQNHWCLEFGAWDGKYLSNCYNLIANSAWNSVMIEANANKFIELQNNHKDNEKVHLINRFVEFEGENTLDNILKETPIPNDLDLISIDIDGSDYYVWESLTVFKPKVVVIEFNPTIPSDIEFVQEKNMQINHGSSILSISLLGKSKGYELVCTTDCNAFFVKKEYFPLFQIEDNSPATLWDKELKAPRLFQLYDGTIVVSETFDLIWHGIKVDQFDLQKLAKNQRGYGDSQSQTDESNIIPTNRSILKRVVSKLYRTFLKPIIS